ncbi:MAG: hypothetical protein JW820_15290 [Spirochaetales bacterium]|nr:hypothetical protein [Spirochaetales bacterium]
MSTGGTGAAMARGNAIHCGYSDPEINRMLGSAGGDPGGYTRHFDQLEEFFLRLKGEFTVPRLPIHHDVSRSSPEAGYAGVLRQVIEQLLVLVPAPLRELAHLFDPADTLRPAFFKLYRIEDRPYLYLLRLDLMYRPRLHRVVDKGNNDYTPAYSTDCLHMEALNVPLEAVIREEGRVRELRIDQTISSTWVDETGRGYFVQGIWIDNDLTRFFSKLFLPEGARLYPFYPFVCKYKTVCQTVVDFDPEERKRRLPLLHRALAFLRPAMAEIEASMRSGRFSEDNPIYRGLKARVPDGWRSAWAGLSVEPYLNDQDMKEFRIDQAPR